MTKFNERVLRRIYKRIAGSMSGLADINVELQQNVVPHWDPTDRIIRMPPSISFAQNDDEDFEIGRGIMVHESSHVLFAPEHNNNDDDFCEWFNVFCDCNNEYKVAKLWKHLKEPLVNKNKALLRDKKIRERMKRNDNAFMQVLMRCDKLFDWYKPEFPDEFPKDVTEFVNETVAEWNSKRMYSAKGPKLIKFTERVNKKWKELKKDEANKSKLSDKKLRKLMKELGGLIKSGATKKEIDKKRKEIADSQCERTKWHDKPDQSLVRPALSSGVDYNKYSLDELKKLLEEHRKTGMKSKGGWGSDLVDTNRKVIGVKPKEKFGSYPYDTKKAYIQGKKINRNLRKKITLQQDYEKRHRSGRIDLNEVRRQVGQLGRLYKETIFQRDNTFNRGGKWAIEVLVDCSGSMHAGNKMSEAKQAFATLGYALDGLPNVHYALTGFEQSCGDVIDIQIKTFEDKKFNPSNIDCLGAGGGNAEGYNIRASAKRLLKFKNVKKVMVVISDGQPAYRDGIDHTRESVKLAEKYGVKVIGIGIEGATEKSLEHIYPNHYYFEKTENLHHEITSLILRALGQKDKVHLLKRKW